MPAIRTMEKIPMTNPATTAVAEQESPILYLESHDGSWRTKQGTGWACGSGLRALFELADAKRIVFVSKQRADRSTYKVRLGSACMCGCGTRRLLSPINSSLCNALSRWLDKQIKAGRPNIGVRILSP